MQTTEREEDLEFELVLFDEECAAREMRDAILATTENEWLKLFPEVKTYLPKILRDRQEDAVALKKRIKDKLCAVKDASSTEKLRTRLTILVNEGVHLSKVVEDIARLKRQIILASGKRAGATSKRVTEEDIIRAREVPITSILGIKARPGSKFVMAKCPIHPDKTPSLAVYGDNHFHCFGCSAHGDAITLIERVHHLSFIEAVQRLNAYV